jgi:hypothetical protein
MPVPSISEEDHRKPPAHPHSRTRGASCRGTEES